MHRPFLALSLALSLTACATGSPLATPKTPAQTLYALEAATTAAEEAALAYASLPSCQAAPSPAACSSPPLVLEMNAAAQTASAAILTAQLAVQDPTQSPAAQAAAINQATQALTALTQLTTQARTP